MDALEGDPNFEEGGNPFTLNLFMAALDPVLLDSFACSLLGLKTSDVPYIKKAAGLGVGSEIISADTIQSLNKGKGLDNLQRSSLAASLSSHIHEKGACSACFSSLAQALKQMQEESLPLPETIRIGQGFKKKISDGLGVGDCLSKCSSFVPGCPPEPSQIANYLRNSLENKFSNDLK